MAVLQCKLNGVLTVLVGGNAQETQRDNKLVVALVMGQFN